MTLMDLPHLALRNHTIEPDRLPSMPPVCREYARGAWVFRAGTMLMPSVVVSGALRINQPGDDPDHLQLALPGDLIGLEALHAWTLGCDVYAVVDTVIATLRPMSDAQWRETLVNALLRHQSQGTSLGHVRAGSAAQRVCRLLLKLANHGRGMQDQVDLREPVLCQLPTLVDMAAITSTAAETVSRVISSLRRFRLIEDQGNHLVRLNPGLLHGSSRLPGGMTRSRSRTCA